VNLEMILERLLEMLLRDGGSGLTDIRDER
jgi:hypothetical protein